MDIGSSTPSATGPGDVGLADRARSAAIRRRLEREYVVCQPTTCAELEHGLADVDDNTDVVIDVSHLAPLDGATVECLRRNAARLEASRCSLSVVNASPDERQVLADASLDKLVRRRRR